MSHPQIWQKSKMVRKVIQMVRKVLETIQRQRESRTLEKHT